MKGLHLLIFGRVQGVYFRVSTQKQANQLGLSGWVRNRHDGCVEVYAEGQEDELIQFLHWCGKGPTMAKVTQVQTRWTEAAGSITSFEIHPTA